MDHCREHLLAQGLRHIARLEGELYMNFANLQ